MAVEKVMFTAVADLGATYGPFETTKTLVFNKTVTNIGKAYNAPSGIFTAPVEGLYYFTFFYCAGEHKSGLSLMKNDETVVATYNTTGSDRGDNSGNAAFLKLEVGDQVYVSLPGGYRVWGAGKTTSFSGFLVSKP
ncbi:complement C1q-like protein 4 [Micropterus salmoides]|uniref:complement C1q-like protein 4 n=1 Tax=Micropterus salmoides TaxID=27706 RepID=UPI0018ECE8FC|nr:complement C1q-like protein 4 [Micropterus salmoides]